MVVIYLIKSNLYSPSINPKFYPIFSFIPDQIIKMTPISSVNDQHELKCMSKRSLHRY